jgi:hypothetical protein
MLKVLFLILASFLFVLTNIFVLASTEFVHTKIHSIVTHYNTSKVSCVFFIFIKYLLTFSLNSDIYCDNGGT